MTTVYLRSLLTKTLSYDSVKLIQLIELYLVSNVDYSNR